LGDFQQYAFVWASVVASSQALQVVRNYLPYKARLKALASLSADLNVLCLVAEDQWYKVSNGTGLYDDDIHAMRMALKKKKLAVVQKSFPTASIPEDKGLAKRAESDTAEYFSTYLEES
jgi:hypothetical protein